MINPDSNIINIDLNLNHVFQPQLQENPLNTNIQQIPQNILPENPQQNNNDDIKKKVTELNQNYKDYHAFQNVFLNNDVLMTYRFCLSAGLIMFVLCIIFAILWFKECINMINQNQWLGYVGVILISNNIIGGLIAFSYGLYQKKEYQECKKIQNRIKDRISELEPDLFLKIEQFFTIKQKNLIIPKIEVILYPNFKYISTKDNQVSFIFNQDDVENSIKNITTDIFDFIMGFLILTNKEKDVIIEDFTRTLPEAHIVLMSLKLNNQNKNFVLQIFLFNIFADLLYDTKIPELQELSNVFKCIAHTTEYKNFFESLDIKKMIDDMKQQLKSNKESDLNDYKKNMQNIKAKLTEIVITQLSKNNPREQEIQFNIGNPEEGRLNPSQIDLNNINHDNQQQQQNSPSEGIINTEPQAQRFPDTSQHLHL